MGGRPVTAPEGLLPRGRFARINGREYEIVGTSRAGHISAEDAVTLRAEVVPDGFREVPRLQLPLDPGLVQVPQAQLSDWGRRLWVARHEGDWFWVNDWRGEGGVHIVTSDQDLVARDDRWHGSLREGGWELFVAWDDLDARAVWVPAGAPLPTMIDGETVHT